jgi:uncharacterized membrane protein HdeD (DUF308 family)
MANTARTGMDLPIVGRGLLSSLADNWWMLLIRGIAAIVFGILAFAWPGLTLLTLTLLWGAYAIIDGVFAMWAAFNAVGGEAGPRWWLGIGGVVSILAGIVAFVYTGPTTLVLLFLIGSWAIVIGAIEIWGAIDLHKVLDQSWLLVLSGVLSIAFGVILFAQPGAGALAVVWVIASYAVLFGCLFIALAFRLKKFKHPA